MQSHADSTGVLTESMSRGPPDHRESRYRLHIDMQIKAPIHEDLHGSPVAGHLKEIQEVVVDSEPDDGHLPAGGYGPIRAPQAGEIPGSILGTPGSNRTTQRTEYRRHWLHCDRSPLWEEMNQQPTGQCNRQIAQRVLRVRAAFILGLSGTGPSQPTSQARFFGDRQFAVVRMASHLPCTGSIRLVIDDHPVSIHSVGASARDRTELGPIWQLSHRRVRETVAVVHNRGPDPVVSNR